MPYLFTRYLNHLAQLVDAIHILCGNRISMNELEEAEQLLFSFAENFEHLYGESNTVFNIHIVRHLADCVKFIGPLFVYSNYYFEDFIGHLVSLHKGTTDVATQICEKYLSEKNLFHFLEQSTIGKEFYDDMDSKRKFSVSRRIAGSLVIRNAMNPSQLTEHERLLIISSLNVANDIQIDEYGSVLLDCKVFYEITSCTNKRTNDSFVFDIESKKFAEIKSILVIHEKLYFLVNERFEKINDHTKKCQFINYLKEADPLNQKVLESKYIGPKYALIKYDDVITCSKFPNMYERN